MTQVVQKYDIKTTKEDANVIADSYNEQKQLLQLIQEEEERSERKFNQFQNDIEKIHLIRLEEEVKELQEKIINKKYTEFPNNEKLEPG